MSETLARCPCRYGLLFADVSYLYFTMIMNAHDPTMQAVSLILDCNVICLPSEPSGLAWLSYLDQGVQGSFIARIS
jgi:hypothetical protein